jgi:hypothetical protein
MIHAWFAERRALYSGVLSMCDWHWLAIAQISYLLLLKFLAQSPAVSFHPSWVQCRGLVCPPIIHMDSTGLSPKIWPWKGLESNGVQWSPVLVGAESLWTACFHLELGQNWVKLHKTSCEHKLNVFLNKIEYADNYHIWKSLKYLAFSACEQNPRG